MEKKFDLAVCLPVYLYLVQVLNDEDFKKIDAFLDTNPSTDDFFQYVADHHRDVMRQAKFEVIDSHTLQVS